MERETWTQAECDLVVELSRYHAQTLLASRNGFDIDDLLPNPELPRDGVVPVGTVLLDGALSAFERAVACLLTCEFATETEGPPFHACKLLHASDRFEVTRQIELPYSNQSHLGNAFSAVFKMYEQNGRLGHPSTLKRIFDRCTAVRLIEKRFGFQEWSEMAQDLAYPRRRNCLPYPETEYLWPTEAFGWYLEEAERQWS